MINLVVTILGIILVAIGALMAVWYGGSVFQSMQGTIWGNEMLNQSQQIYTAATQYAVNNSQDFSTVTYANLVAQNYLLKDINIGNRDASSSSGLNTQHPGSNCLNDGTGEYEYITRYPCVAGSSNLITWSFGDYGNVDCGAQGGTNGYGYESASMLPHETVQACLAINKNANLPAGLTYAPSGLPYYPAGTTPIQCNNTTYGHQFLAQTAGGTPLINACYLPVTSGVSHAITYFVQH